jgi:peptidoglycan/LPS O-acetylase OafA/YrhL
MKFWNLFFDLAKGRNLQTDSLDGVRGLAVLFVLFSHVANKNILIIDGLKFAGNGSGQLGVYLFFVLSAFLLTRPLIRLDKKSIKSWSVWKDYLLRRILRIFPLYIIVLFTVVKLVSFNIPVIVEDFPNFSYPDMLSHLILKSGQNHFWTITTEFKYYLILPFLVFVYTFCLKENIVAIALSNILISTLTSIFVYFNPPDIRYSILQYLPIFIFGSFLAFFQKWYQQSSLVINSKYFTYLGLLCLVTMILLMPNTFIKIFKFDYILFSPLATSFWGILFSTFIFFIINEKGILNKFFRNKIMRFLGIISYSTYLWHWFILNSISAFSNLNNVEKIFLFYTTTFIISGISFLVFEKPLLRVILSKNK